MERSEKARKKNEKAIVIVMVIVIVTVKAATTRYQLEYVRSKVSVCILFIGNIQRSKRRRQNALGQADPGQQNSLLSTAKSRNPDRVRKILHIFYQISRRCTKDSIDSISNSNTCEVLLCLLIVGVPGYRSRPNF